MKTTTVLLLGAVVTTITLTSLAAEPLLSPRAAGNQIKALKGTNAGDNPVLACRSNMVGSPKAVTECSSHTTMPGCMAVASLK